MTGSWEPLPISAVRHVLNQIDSTASPSEQTLEAFSQRFHAPESSVFHFSASRRVVGRTTLMLSTQSAFRLSADPESHSDSIHIGFVLNGSMRIGWGGDESHLLNAISAIAVQGWGASGVEALDMSRMLDIEIPRERLGNRGIRLRGSQLRIDGAASLSAPLRAFALSVVDRAWVPSTLGSAVAERTIEDLVVGMLLESGSYAMDGEDLRTGLRMRALSRIAADHQDPDFTPVGLAAGLGVSLRHLQRAFEGSGTSIAEQINRQRARTAAVSLSTPANALTIADIAKRSGFASTFELRSSFKAEYGVLPSEFRARPS